MPAARQMCTGSMRLVEVKERPKKDKIDCPDCTLTLDGTYTVQKPHEYMLTPSHIAVGVRVKERSNIDWADPKWTEVAE